MSSSPSVSSPRRAWALLAPTWVVLGVFLLAPLALMLLVSFAERGTYGGRILMLDDPREAFGVALKLMGRWLNETDPAVLRQAAERLKAQKRLVKTYNSSDPSAQGGAGPLRADRGPRRDHPAPRRALDGDQGAVSGGNPSMLSY